MCLEGTDMVKSKNNYQETGRLRGQLVMCCDVEHEMCYGLPCQCNMNCQFVTGLSRRCRATRTFSNVTSWKEMEMVGI